MPWNLAKFWSMLSNLGTILPSLLTRVTLSFEQSVIDDIKYLKSSPYIAKTIKIQGFVFDMLKSGRLLRIEEKQTSNGLQRIAVSQSSGDSWRLSVCALSSASYRTQISWPRKRESSARSIAQTNIRRLQQTTAQWNSELQSLP